MSGDLFSDASFEDDIMTAENDAKLGVVGCYGWTTAVFVIASLYDLLLGYHSGQEYTVTFRI